MHDFNVKIKILVWTLPPGWEIQDVILYHFAHLFMQQTVNFLSPFERSPSKSPNANASLPIVIVCHAPPPITMGRESTPHQTLGFQDTHSAVLPLPGGGDLPPLVRGEGTNL